jgi:hypothetical protein
MSGFEVQDPVLSGPFDEPAEPWHIVEGEEPRRGPGSRSGFRGSRATSR